MRQFCEIGSLSVGDEFKSVNDSNDEVCKVVRIFPYTVEFTIGGGHVLFGREKDSVVEIINAKSNHRLTDEERAKFIAYCRFQAEFYAGNAWAIRNEKLTDAVEIATQEHRAKNEHLMGIMYAIVSKDMEEK